MSDYSSFAKPVDDYSSFATPVDDYAAFAKPVDEEEDSVFSKKGLLDLGSTIPFTLGKQAQGVKQAFGDLIGDEQMSANAAAARKQLLEEEKKVKLNLGDGVGEMAYGGVKSTLQAIPALGAAAINPVLGMGMIGGGTGAEAYAKYRDRGATKGEAATGGLLEGGIEAGTELLPMGFILKKMGKEGFVNFVKGLAIREGFGEQVATLGQDAVDTAIANPNKTWQQYLEERPKAALATAIATGVQVGLMGGAGAVGARLSPTQGATESGDVKANLDALDKQKEIEKQTQGEGTLYVGKDGDVTGELPVKVGESKEQVDIARTELQNNLQREATAREEQVQGDLFPLEPEQQNLDLVTRPEEPTPVVNEAGTFSDTAMFGPRFAPKDLQTFQLANGKVQTTPEAILKWYEGKVSEDQEIAAILPKIKEAIDQFQGKHGLVIELVDKPNAKGKTPALYVGNEHKIYIGQTGMTGRVALHEIVHGVTHRFIEAMPDHPAVKQLQAILDYIKTDPRVQKQYGSQDVHELVAEGFSSLGFKKTLMQIGMNLKDGQLQNAWDVFVDSIGQLFNTPTSLPAERTALAKVLEAGFDISKQYSRQKLDIDKKYMEKYWKNELPIQKAYLAKRLDPVTQGAISAAKAAETPPQLSDPEVAKNEQVEKLTGEVYIPKNPTIDEALINKIKGEPDGSSVWALTPGALGRSELSKSTLVKTIYRLMNGAYKRAEYKNQTVVKPTQDAFIKILRNPEQAKISHDILMREMKRGNDYTAEELRSAGVKDDVIKAHLQFRAMMQEALEVQNKQLRDKGLPEVKGIDSYISSRWSGPWRANIRDAEGNIVWQVAEHSQKKAKDAIAWIKKKQPDLTIEDPKYRKGFEKGDSVEGGYLDMLKMLDKNDPRVAVLESIYKDYLMGNTENISSQEKHFLRKTGVRGFAGDRGWSDTDVRDFFVQQFAYAENAFRWSEAQKSMEGVKALLNNKDLQDSQKNNIQFSKEYVKSQLGFGKTETFEAIDNGLAKVLGTSPQKLQEYMGAAKTFFYLTKLGLSIPFTVTQFLQPAITTPGWHSQLDSLGYKHNPVRSAFKSIVGGAEAALWHYGVFFNAPELTKAAEKTMSPLDIEAAKYMEANGIIDINPMTDIKKGLRPEAVNVAAYPFEFTIKHSEVIARSMAFMGFVDHLKQSGKFDLSKQDGRLKLFEKAEDMTNLSMTDYRTQERALTFEKMGLTGDAAATLHSYQINNLMQLVKFGKEAKGGNPMPLIYMISMQAMAAGLTGLWFIDDLDDLINNLKKLLPHDQYMKVKDFSLKNFILQNRGDLVSYGLVSKVSSTNIHTRLNASDQIPVWPFESDADPLKNVLGIAPFIESTYDVGMGAAKALSPNSTPQERWAGAYAAAPTAAQGPMENLPAFSDQGVSLKPKDLSLGKIRRTEEEKSLRNKGFKSLREQRQSDQEFQLSKVEMQLNDRMATEAKKAKQFFVSGDPKNAVDHLIKYDQLGGDLSALINSVPKAKLGRVTTEVQRRALTAQGGTKPSILKLQRYLQQVQQ